jgi:membrane protein DedA with SNARE-associated domain
MFSAIRVPRDFAAWGTLAAAIEASVLIGSSVLFAASRRWGRRLIHGEVGEAMHLTPDRVARAEGWFRRWGIWAVIFGRHVPGFRVATTVVAASFGVRFPVFLAGVTISAGVWVAAFMTLGLLIGPRAERLLGAHHTTRLVVLGAAMGIGIVYVAGRLGWKRLRPGAGRPPSTAARRQ